MKSHAFLRSRRHFLRRLGVGSASLALPLGVTGCVDRVGIIDPGQQYEPPLPPPGAPPELRFAYPGSVVLDQHEIVEQLVRVVTSSGTMMDPWVQFSSSDESVAVVSPRGLVFGLQPGSARISVSAEGAVGQFDVVVREPQSVQRTAGPGDIVVQGFTSHAIAAALKEAVARGPGAVVFLPSGSYDITERLDIPASDITLRGAGRRSTWLVMNHELALQGNMDTIRISRVDRVRIEELGFRYAEKGTAADYGYPNQITIRGSTGSRVHRCVFEAGSSACWHVFIGMEGDVQPSHRCAVTECHATDSRGHGIEINNSDECAVERCVIVRSGMNSIEPYHRQGPFLRGTKVRDNLLIDPVTAGVSVHSDFGSDITGNVVRGSGANGILLSFGERGPDVPSRNGICQRNDVRASGRVTPDNSAGILIGCAAGWIVRQNVATDNRCHGIVVGGASNTVDENTARRNGVCGLVANGVGHRIIGNDFSDNAAGSTAVGSVAAVYSDATEVEFRGNLTEDTRTEKRHREHYYIGGTNVHFVGNRGQAATTASGIAAWIVAVNAVVRDNEDTPDSSA